MSSGQSSEAEPYLAQAVPVLRSLVAEFPRESRYCQNLGGALSNLAHCALDRGDPAEAVRLLEEAVRHQEEAVRLAPRDAHIRLFLRNHYATLARALPALRRHPEALAAARKALAIADRLRSDFPEVPRFEGVLADAYGDLGQVLLAGGRGPDAEAAFREALAIQEGLVERFPKVPIHRNSAAITHCRLGGLLQSSVRWRDAVEHYRRAVQLFPQSAEANNGLAWLLALGADPAPIDPAELVWMARAATEGDPKNPQYRVTLGLAHLRAGRSAEALSILERAEPMGSQGPAALLVLAMARWHTGDKDRARLDLAAAQEQIEQATTLDESTRRLRAEAAALIGVTAP
jgi:tetratricopeptide (TPR) repeat protein